MTQADRIRQFVARKYIAPARARGERAITIRAGDVHHDIGLKSAMPAVCSALRGAPLQQLAGVTLVRREGPENGSNVFFTFSLGSSSPNQKLEIPINLVERAQSDLGCTSGEDKADLDFRDAIVLVSCVKLKQPRPAPARDLYVSPWFQKARQIVERHGATWFIVSALHGLLKPEEVIAPYEQTLKKMSAAQRRQWAGQVWSKLQPELVGKRRAVFFAGETYRQHLIAPIRKEGLEVEVPMKNLALGEQLAWLSRHT